MDITFSNKDYDVSRLVSEIETGDLGLPELQRPFVWKRSKVRDLLDSMYAGFPVGNLLFWETGVEAGSRRIGVDDKQSAPKKLIIDGQQRLTSLYAVFTGTKVLDDQFEPHRIRIAFHPVRGEFAVATAAHDKTWEWISDISNFWSQGDEQFFELAEEYVTLQRQQEKPADEVSTARSALQRLHNLRNHKLTAVELASSVEVDQVAEVFVRINSKGLALKESDFILTLMSVYWEEGRRQLEEFIRRTRDVKDPVHTVYLQPEPEHIVRISNGLAFRRGRLRYAYALLRGKDLESGQESTAFREQSFAKLSDAQAQVFDATSWREFQKALLLAGFQSGRWITSDLAIVYSYLLFLIGRNDYGVEIGELRRTIARWFFMASLTRRYTGTPESVIERELGNLPEEKSAAAFVDHLHRGCDTALTNDFWEIELPELLGTTASASPALYAYYASLCLLDARVLFSELRCATMFQRAGSGGRADLEAHHLFPKAYLKRIGVTSKGRSDQIANFALVEWPDNGSIRDHAPEDYFPRVLEQLPSRGLSPSDIDQMMHLHALTAGWESMRYDDFLTARRRALAQVTREGWELLRHGAVREASTV